MAVPADILGQVYEQSLGRIIRLTSGQQFPDRMARSDIGAVFEKADDLLQVNWGNRQAEWH